MDHTELFDLFLRIRKREDLHYIDTHIHPYDVLGVCSDHAAESDGLKNYSPSLLEKLEFNKFAVNALKGLFFVAPAYIKHSIRNNYRGFNKEALLKEMGEAGITQGVLIPVEPFSNSIEISAQYSGKDFYLLGSVNIHALHAADIEAHITKQINKAGIAGLKLHPNVQNFYPRPKDNPADLAEKLRRIYKVAQRKNLYLLFHTGLSYLFHLKHRKIDKALISNFLHGSQSEIFGLGVPIILAHGGNYNVNRPDFKAIQKIIRNYKNVFFDTAGLNPHLLAKIIEVVGVDRIVFGSDANYFNLQHSVKLVLKALAMAQGKETLEERIIKVFSTNYQTILLGK